MICASVCLLLLNPSFAHPNRILIRKNNVGQVSRKAPW